MRYKTRPVENKVNPCYLKFQKNLLIIRKKFCCEMAQYPLSCTIYNTVIDNEATKSFQNFLFWLIKDNIRCILPPTGVLTL
jgi:hypothetical protein